MSFLGIFFFFVARLLDVLLFALFARVVLSWFVAEKQSEHPVYQFLHDVTEPLFRVARVIPHQIGMVDISALYAFILLQVLANIVAYVHASILY